ncbi:hypothetical protein M0R45_009013 [Rubus argutus]|uniref:Uncharacterized protein n=1 Tax=Rubus argutus TaxID=59490 RepID=A0AAW1Y2T9_RUBAR
MGRGFDSRLRCREKGLSPCSSQICHHRVLGPSHRRASLCSARNCRQQLSAFQFAVAASCSLRHRRSSKSRDLPSRDLLKAVSTHPCCSAASHHLQPSPSTQSRRRFQLAFSSSVAGSAEPVSSLSHVAAAHCLAAAPLRCLSPPLLAAS